MEKIVIVLVAFCIQFAGPSLASQVDTKQFIYGAGPSTKLVQLFVAEFAKLPAAQGFTFEVPPKSVKHAGGVNSSDKYLFGRTGRPLNDKEKSMNKEEIILGQVPVVIAVGAETGITSLELGQLEKIVNGSYSNWKEVGGVDAPITNVGREENEAAFSALKQKYSFYKTAKFNQSFGKDDDVVSYLENVHGKHAIAFGAVSNFTGRKDITVLSVKGFSLGLKMGLVYDQANQGHPVVKAAADFAAFQDWAAIVTANGFLAPGE